MTSRSRPGIRILVTGGRNYTNRPQVNATLSAIHERNPIGLLICGGARGADRLALEWALVNGVAAHVYPAQWQLHGLKAGPVRNQEMVDAEPRADHCVAFPGTVGTPDCIARAKKAGIPVMDAITGAPL